jgi:hypothetical protein
MRNGDHPRSPGRNNESNLSLTRRTNKTDSQNFFSRTDGCHHDPSELALGEHLVREWIVQVLILFVHNSSMLEWRVADGTQTPTSVPVRRGMAALGISASAEHSDDAGKTQPTEVGWVK